MDKRFIRSYGIGGYASMFTWTMYTANGMFFYTDIVGLSPTIASTIIMIGTLWDAITDPIIGAWSDKRKDPRGKRRPVILNVIIPFGIVTWLLFTDFHLGETMTIVYFTFITIVFYTLQTLLDISYSSLAAEVTLDYDVRSKLCISRGIWESVAMIVSSFVIMSTKTAGDILGDPSQGWSFMGAAFGVICMVTIFAFYKKTAGCEKLADQRNYFVEQNGESYWKRFFGSFKNETFRNISIMYTLGIFSQTIFAAYNVYYCMENVGLTETQVTIALLCVWGGGLACVPLIDGMLQKIGKKATWAVTIGLLAATFFVFPLFIQKEHSLILLCVQNLLLSAGFQAIYLVPWAMIPDAVEVDEFRTGQRNEGLYYGVASCMQKVGSAVAYILCGIYLEVIHYNSALAVQSAETLTGLKYAMSIGCAVPMAISVIVALKNPMTKELHEKYLVGIERKKGGLPTDDLNIR